MKEKILKLVGYNECCYCNKLFAKYGGNKVFVVTKDHLYSDKFITENKFFCREHKPDFVLALNGLSNNGSLFEETITFTQYTKGFSNNSPLLRVK